MELRLPNGVVEMIREHGRETYPEECCGFLIGKEGSDVSVVTESRRARNIHPESRASRYTIDPRDVLQVDREFRGDVRHVGFYHSHPDYPPRPSDFDLRHAWPYYVYAILAVESGEPGTVTAWSLDESSRSFREAKVSIA